MNTVNIEQTNHEGTVAPLSVQKCNRDDDLNPRVRHYIGNLSSALGAVFRHQIYYTACQLSVQLKNYPYNN